MCQLIFVNAGSKVANRFITYELLLSDTVTTHRDGCGVWTLKGGLKKTSMHPWELTTAGHSIFKIVKDASPVIAHVRQASLTAGKRLVSPENAHPFEKKNLILAHNGSLTFVDAKEEHDPKWKDMIDSEIFATILDEIMETQPELTFSQQLNLAYQHFDGKFAFLIYNKVDASYYVVRGQTARLHVCRLFYQKSKEEIEDRGFVVNTDDTTLLPGLNHAFNDIQILGGEVLGWFKPELLKENTIFRLNPESNILEEVGTIVETKKEYVYVTPPYSQSWEGGTHRGGYTGGGTWSKEKEESPMAKAFQAVLKFQRVTGLTIEEIDKLFDKVLGIPLLEAKLVDIQNFVTYVIPVLDKEERRYPNNLKEWEKIKDEVTAGVMGIYPMFRLQFPYFLNSTDVLRKIRKDLSNHL